MKINFLIFIFIVSLGNAIAQKAVKFDTTMKLNKAGYRIRCSNKNADKNNLMIGPIGFENTARDVEFEIKGRINKCELEDFNNDGFPDAVLYIIDANQKGSVIGLSSEKNEKQAITVTMNFHYFKEHCFVAFLYTMDQIARITNAQDNTERYNTELCPEKEDR